MKEERFIWRLAAGVLLLLFVLACDISFNAKEEEKSEPEMTLEAIYREGTMTAEAARGSEDTADESTEEEPEAAIEHTTIPGNPGSPDLTKDEIDTENTAGSKTALGDSFRLSNYERPFTPIEMAYHPETDLVRLHLSKGDNFYYFTLELSGVDKEKNYPSAGYGIEFDTDKDGRGDYLLWATGDESTEWNIEEVMLLRDSNEDVGGSNPVVPDTNDGNGYDQVLFSKDELNDPDSAWKRVDPTNTSNVQLAVKISLIDNNHFFLRAWADAGLANSAKFDYNDTLDESQAGAPSTASSYYPVDQLNLMDSTCWIAYNLTPTGTEIGGCVVLQPEQPPPPPPGEKPGCNCDLSPAAHGQKCCVQCGYVWYSEKGVCGPKLY